MNERIGELLVKENLLSAEQLAKAREETRSKGGRLGSQITELGFLDESELSDFVAKHTPECWCLKVERNFDYEEFIIRTGNSNCVCPVCLTGKEADAGEETGRRAD